MSLKLNVGRPFRGRRATEGQIPGASLEPDRTDANAETQKVIKRYHQQIRESQTKLEDEVRAKDNTRDVLIAAERRANSMQNALEEARTLLEQADRSRRITEQELSDTNEQLSDLTCNNQAIAGAKRKLESEMQTLHVSIHC